MSKDEAKQVLLTGWENKLRRHRQENKAAEEEMKIPVGQKAKTFCRLNETWGN